MSRIEIRPTSPDDLDALADVLVEVHAANGYPVEGVQDPRAWLDLPTAIAQWTALFNGRPVGHVALCRTQPDDGAPRLLAKQEGVPMSQIAVLSRLFVDPKTRRNGLASELVKIAEATAQDMHLHLTLDVMQKDKMAISLYQRLGWRSLGPVVHEIGESQRVAAAAFAAPRADLDARGAAEPEC